jgi:hypothetical protein
MNQRAERTDLFMFSGGLKSHLGGAFDAETKTGIFGKNNFHHNLIIFFLAD